MQIRDIRGRKKVKADADRELVAQLLQCFLGHSSGVLLTKYDGSARDKGESVVFYLSACN